jgi:hypothetical protein
MIKVASSVVTLLAFSVPAFAEIPIQPLHVLTNQLVHVKESAEKVMQLTKNSDLDPVAVCHEVGMFEVFAGTSVELAASASLDEELKKINPDLPNAIRAIGGSLAGSFCREDGIYEPVKGLPGQPNPESSVLKGDRLKLRERVSTIRVKAGIILKLIRSEPL